MAGLMPDSLRLDQPGAEKFGDGDITIEDAEPKGDQEELDGQGNVIKVEHGDGSITISIDGSPVKSAKDSGPLGWFDNLVDRLDQSEVT